MEDVISKVKKYVEDELHNMETGYYDPKLCLERAYGAVTFVLNYDDVWNGELASWWSDYALPKFNKRAGMT
jgi:hypothetical protein